MPSITFREPDGTVRTVSAPSGESVMRAAVNGSVSGIVGQCGGALACASCHVYVSGEAFREVGDLEDELLEGAASERLPNSMLSCQIEVDDVPAGIEFVTPPVQL